MSSCFSALSSLLSSKPSSQDEKPLSSSASSVSTLMGSAFMEKDAARSLLSLPTTRSISTTAQLNHLRSLLLAEGLTHYLVPSEDAHRSEYTATQDQRRAFVSGFTGSAGTAVVSLDEAHIFVDGRYHVQATDQCDENWTVHKLGLPDVINWDAWLCEKAKSTEIKLGMDPTLMDYSAAKSLITVLTPHKGSVIFPSRNLIDVVWGSSRPSPTIVPVYQHPLKFAGQKAEEKLLNLQKWLTEQGEGVPDGSSFMVTSLDEIIWITNTRGASIPCNPVYPAYLLVPSRGSATLFVPSDLLKSDSGTFKYLTEDLNIRIKEYDDVWASLRAGEWIGKNGFSDSGSNPKLVTSDKVSYAVVNAVGDENVKLISYSDSPVAIAKACKNQTELQGFRNCYLRDGAAWARWAAWLEKEVKVKKSKITEFEAAEKFAEIRSKADLYAGFDAYEAISATGPNAALPHYETPAEGSAIIDTQTPYLNDSGAQYLDGTIDTTRTVHFGKPTKEHRRAFTVRMILSTDGSRVLQGHIAIDTAIFPAGTTGAKLDALARAPSWKDLSDYNHGTGHGIGSFGNVHEGPVGFSTSSGGAQVPTVLQAGNCLSNEPGYYKEGGFGIRIESILGVKELKTIGGRKWYSFERFTQVPIDVRLVDFSLLSPFEAAWLKHHNKSVRNAVLPLIKDDKLAVKWMRRQ